MLILSVSYLLLLRFVRKRNLNNSHSKRRIHVTNLSQLWFFHSSLLMPNPRITFWGVLVKLNVIHWDEAYYKLSILMYSPSLFCLAHTNTLLKSVYILSYEKGIEKETEKLFVKYCPLVIIKEVFSEIWKACMNHATILK